MGGSEIGIAYLDAASRELGSQGGFETIQLARTTAQVGLRARTYATSVKVVIYRGRTLAEGGVLEEVALSR